MPRTFVGRAGDVRRVVEALAAETPQVCIIHGLGGVGKSTLAAHIASTYPDTVVRWWITAASFSDIEHGLAALGRELAPTLSVALSDMGTATDEIYCKLAQQWLATRGEWLIVLDNAEDPACIGRILGRLSTGTVIVTSRRASGWHDVGAAVGLETLDSSAATTLLIGIATHGGHRDVTGASELCAALGHLPLVNGHEEVGLGGRVMSRLADIGNPGGCPPKFSVGGRGSSGVRSAQRDHALAG